MKLLLTLLFSVTLYSQSAPQIIDYNATVKGAIFGDMRCNFWSQSPQPGMIQIACYVGTAINYNSVQLVTITNIFGSFPFKTGNIAWVMTPSLTATKIDYQISVAPINGQPLMKAGTF